MNRADCIDVTKRLINNSKNRCTDLAEKPMIENADVFTDSGRHQRERQRLFMNTPQVIGFAGEVREANSYITVEVLGIPVIVCRDSNGTLNAFINACAHRGARVAQDCGVKKRFTCSYHGWSYGLDGQLAGRPQDDAFEPANEHTQLQSLPVSVNAGLIVIGLHTRISQAQVDEHLNTIAPQLCGFEFDQVNTLETRRFCVDANWKLVTGLSHEAYHFNTLHRDSLAPVMTAHAIYDTFGQHSRWAFPLRGIESLEQEPEKDWPERPPAAMNHTLFPGCVLIVTPSDAQLIRAEPGKSPGESIVFYSGVYRSSSNKDDALAAYNFGGEIFETEDLPAAVQCQQGLNAGQPTVIFGKNEPIVQFWHKLWNQALEPET